MQHLRNRACQEDAIHSPHSATLVNLLIVDNEMITIEDAHVLGSFRNYANSLHGNTRFLECDARNCHAYLLQTSRHEYYGLLFCSNAYAKFYRKNRRITEIRSRY
jgi:hypothetical protein